MLERWGHLVHRRRWQVLLVSLVAILFGAVWGTGVFDSLRVAGGFTTPGSDSMRAAQLAERGIGRTDADVVILYRSEGLTIDDPAFMRAVTGAVAALPRDKVVGATTYWSSNLPQLVTPDRKATYAVLQLAGADDQARSDTYLAIKDRLKGAPGATAQVGGAVTTSTTISEQVSADIAKGEAVSIPILLILLVVIFGGLAAASLPLAIGGMAILGSFTALHLLTLGTNVSIFAVNITTFLGLGLAIDYGLFVVARFRDELGREDLVSDALARTMATAGRTVLVSGVTVATSLAGLMLFPQMFLRSMGYGGVATVLVCMLAALTVLPALLAVLGARVNALSLRRRARTPRGDGDSVWYRLARSVMRRPLIYVVVTVAMLVGLGLPFLRIEWSGIDGKVLPAGAEARVVAETLESEFPRGATTPIDVVLKGDTDPAAYAERLQRMPGVTAAHVTGARGDTAKIALRYAAAPESGQARALVQRVREVPPPPGTQVYVGGRTAETVDQLASLRHILPWLALLVGAATFILLFLAFGSVVLPLKAIVMNVLSLSATYGVMVWIFQDGNLSGALDFTATGALAPAMPILMLALLFGISMDYEVFLLSRVREAYDTTGRSTAAVATGLQRTGAIITSAALLFLVVMSGFSLSGITFVKMTGVCMITAIVIDATIVRALLVPATMRLLGRANWWAPAPLRGLYRRYGIREEATPTPQPRVPEPVDLDVIVPSDPNEWTITSRSAYRGVSKVGPAL